MCHFYALILKLFPIELTLFNYHYGPLFLKCIYSLFGDVLPSLLL